MTRRRAGVFVVVACVGLGAYLLYPYAVVAHLAGAIAGASTASAEVEALCRANRWFHSGLAPTYSVRPRDSEGHELRPWQDGSYDRIASLTLTWQTGQSVERTLLTRDGLSCVFGE